LAGCFRSYRVLLFFDGDNGGQWRKGLYTITGQRHRAATLQDDGEDSEGVDFNAGGGTTGTRESEWLFQIPVEGGLGNQMWPASPKQ